MRSFTSLLVSILSLSALSFAKSSSGDSVLVILEDKLQQDSYSIFFNGLKERGYDLTFRAPKDVSPVMVEDGYPKFSNVIVFAPTTKSYAADITPQNLVSLLGKNTNVIFALSEKQTPLMSLASEFSLILPPPGTPLISHFPKRDEPADIIPISVASSPILTPGLSPVWFKGVPHAYGSNPYLVPILSAPVESFAADTTSDAGADAVFDASEKGGEGLWAGSSLGVVTGFQASTNARAAWVGGVEVFSDEFANKEISKGVQSGNKQFALDVAAWAFQESLVLRIDNTSHWAVADHTHTPKEMYTTNENIHFGAQISAYDSKTGRWQPYSGLKDLQLEFTMLDPHIRTASKHKAGSPEGTYEVDFRAPDRHGVFKFVIDYKRKGYTHLSSSTVVPVVPPRHDGYPRFLSAAWPYYTGAISTSIAFLLFSAVWLGGGPVEVLKKKTTKIE